MTASAALDSGAISASRAPSNERWHRRASSPRSAPSSFVAPLVQQWEADYVNSPAAVTITYGAIGSGGGVDQVTARTVDFGASDAPLSSDQAAACKGCIQIPWSLGAVAITYNVK